MACITGQVISGSDYLNVTNEMADLYTAMQGQAAFMWQALTYVAEIDDVLPEVDLIDAFWSTYQAVVVASNQPTILLGAVSALEKHVLTRCGFQSVDDYIGSQVPGAKVCQNWATLSAMAGYPISYAYILAGC